MRRRHSFKFNQLHVLQIHYSLQGLVFAFLRQKPCLQWSISALSPALFILHGMIKISYTGHSEMIISEHKSQSFSNMFTGVNFQDLKMVLKWAKYKSPGNVTNLWHLYLYVDNTVRNMHKVQAWISIEALLVEAKENSSPSLMGPLFFAKKLWPHLWCGLWWEAEVNALIVVAAQIYGLIREGGLCSAVESGH